MCKARRGVAVTAVKGTATNECDSRFLNTNACTRIMISRVNIFEIIFFSQSNNALCFGLSTTNPINKIN